MANIDRKEIRNVVRKTHFGRRKISLMKYETGKHFEERLIEFLDVGISIMYFRDEILRAYDEVCQKKRCRRSKEDIWWWNVEVKDMKSRKKDTHMVRCWNSTV